MSDKFQNIIFYCLTAFVGMLVLSWFKSAPDSVVEILLYPHARVTEIFYNTPLTYIHGTGYSAIDGTFTIGRECMGIKFLVILFGMTTCMFAKYFKGLNKAAWFIISFAGAILVSILISCIRIVGSVPFVSHPKFALIHSGVGISFYFLALTVTYVILNKLIRSGKSEKNL